MRWRAVRARWRRPVAWTSYPGIAVLGRRGRLAAALLVTLLAAYGLAAGPGTAGRRAVSPAQGDAALYRAIEARVAAGQDYYGAAVLEQRRRHYPTRPFVTVRPPTLAVVTAWVGGPARALLVLRLLGLAAVAALVVRLRIEGLGLWPWGIATALLIGTVLALAQPLLAWWHETWAGLLAMLALASRRPGRWRLSLCAGLLAVLVRELALPLLPVMAGAALLERRRGEALAWTAALLAALAFIALHAAGVAAVTRPDDVVSPGWAVAGGWSFDLAMARQCTLLTLLPWPVAALAVPLALLGWAAWPGGMALRVTALLAAWLAAFMVIGRPDNIYWGLLFGPLLTAGIALAPAALAALWPRARAAT